MQFFRVVVYFFVLIASLLDFKDEVKDKGFKSWKSILYLIVFLAFLILIVFCIIMIADAHTIHHGPLR